MRTLGATALLLTLGGCFTDLTGTRCSDDDGCFPGERCLSGRCVIVLDGDGGPVPEAVTLRVRVEGPEASASPIHVKAEGQLERCDCSTAAGGECLVSVPAGAPTSVCAGQHPFAPCRIEVPAPTEGLEVRLRLSVCVEAEGCAFDVGACGCPETLPLCE